MSYLSHEQARYLKIGEKFVPLNYRCRPRIDWYDSIGNLKEGENVNYLYSIIVVDGSNILIDKKVVAKNEESAKFKVDLHKVLNVAGATPDDVTIHIQTICAVK